MSLPNNNLPTLSIWVRRRWLLAVGGLMILFLAGVWLWWRPIWSQLALLPTAESLLEPKQQLEQDIALLNGLKDKLAVVNQDQLERLKLILPTGQDLPDLVAQLEGIAQKNKFQILTVDFVSGLENSTPEQLVAGSDRGEPKLLNINLSLSTGNYEQLKSLVADIESSLRLLTITGINFSYGSTSSSRNGYQINLVSPYLVAD
ncbi:MAG: hypothetical protein HY973_00080 [Candidatus Kerfeldbacteria bacterium]|nr:hypothetical protein [Candidatus Kerfeldbacteria bacterium]